MKLGCVYWSWKWDAFVDPVSLLNTKMPLFWFVKSHYFVWSFKCIWHWGGKNRFSLWEWIGILQTLWYAIDIDDQVYFVPYCNSMWIQANCSLFMWCGGHLITYILWRSVCLVYFFEMGLVGGFISNQILHPLVWMHWKSV